MSNGVILESNQFTLAQILSSEAKHHNILLNNVEKKVKKANLIYTFEQDLKTIQENLPAKIAQIDFELLWELTEGSHTVELNELTELCFNQASEIETIAILIAIKAQGIYFIWHNNEIKRSNPQEIQQLRYQQQRQKEQEEQFNSIYNKLIKLQQPKWKIDPIEQILNTPNKNSIEYKAFLQASKELKLNAIELLYKLGYITSIDELLIKSFTKKYFPNGLSLDNATTLPTHEEIAFNPNIKLFSIDELTTTEVDDAFSIEYLDKGYKIGVHIAAPALNEELLEIASERISTVYYPSNKITMLPENIISHYSLDQGKILPVVSIYFELDENFDIINNSTVLERAHIAANLRTEELEKVFNNNSLDRVMGYAYEKELKTLYRFARKLEEKRGKASVNQMNVDYTIYFEEDKVKIKSRIRGNPIDKLVSELMILANCSWGRMLTNGFIPAIYRVKQSHTPVKMTLSANSHIGLNVDYYTWASSPLRRSVDLINQTQIINMITKQKPLSSTNYSLANIANTFDDTYGAYLKFQEKLEHYWSLKYLLQENIQEVTATVLYKSIAEINGVPIKIDLTGILHNPQARDEVKLIIGDIDLINQTFSYRKI